MDTDDIPPFHDGTALFHMVGYEDNAEMEVEQDDGTTEWKVTNHDELEKFDEVRRLEVDDIIDVGWTPLTPKDSLYREEFEDLDVNEAVKL